MLGTIHLEEANNKIEMSQYELPVVKFGKINGVKIGRTNIEKYAAELQTALDGYIDNYNSTTSKQNKYTAFGTSVVSFFATIFGQTLGTGKTATTEQVQEIIQEAPNNVA